MKPLKIYHNDDVICFLLFDDGTRLYWREDSPMIIAFPGKEPEPYEEGSVPEIDELMRSPAVLYGIPEDRMNETQERIVKMILGLE